MKITKQELNNIIKHELKSVIKETKAFALSSKYMPIRRIGSKTTGVADPDTDADDADELRSGLDLSGFKLKKMQGMYAIVDANTGEVVLGPFRTESQAQDKMSDPNLASDYEAAKQIMSTRAGDYSSERINEIDDEEFNPWASSFSAEEEDVISAIDSLVEALEKMESSNPDLTDSYVNLFRTLRKVGVNTEAVSRMA